MEEMTEVEKLKAEMKILEAKNRQLEIENEFIKNIAYKLGDSNNNALIFETFDEATSLYRDCCSTSVIFSLLFEQNVYFLTCHVILRRYAFSNPIRIPPFSA